MVITMTTTMIAVPIADNGAGPRRITEFAADVTRLADQRLDLDLRDMSTTCPRPDSS